MPIVNQYPDSMPDFPRYWLRVAKFSQAVRIEGNIFSILGPRNEDVFNIVLPEMQEAAPDFVAAMKYSEDFVAGHLRVDEISLNWYPCLGKNPTYLYESWVRMGDQSDYPEALYCYVVISHNAWKATVETVTHGVWDQLRFEACATVEDGMAWCQMMVADWLYADSVSLFWEESPIKKDNWSANIKLRWLT